VPDLETMGDELRRLRSNVAGLSRPALSIRAQISVRQIEQIERAIRRTRRSTLDRITAALVIENPEMGDSSALVENLVELAGIGLAPESDYRDRIERRRKRRWSRRRGRQIVISFPPLQERLAASLADRRREMTSYERLIGRLRS
jgi:hypothetical protein